MRDFIFPNKLRDLLVKNDADNENNTAVTELDQFLKSIEMQFREVQVANTIMSQSLAAEEQLNGQLYEEIGKLKCQLALVVEYAKRLACPTRLCRVMEIFPVRYLLSVDQAIEDQRDIHDRLLNVLESKSKFDLLGSCIRQLISVIEKKPPENKNAFEAAFKRLKAANFDLLPNQNVNDLNDFGKAVYEINLQSDVDAAFNIWNTAAVVWQNRVNLKKLSSSDDEMVKKLTVIPHDVLLRRIESGVFNLIRERVCDPRHLDYTKACLKTMTIFDPNVSKHYKLVFWTLFMSPNIEITELWNKLDIEWPTLDKSQQADCYATQFAELYNLVSVVDKHGPGLPPSSMCEPSRNDYDKYIQHLAVMGNDRLVFVAKTLCGAI